MLRTLTAVLTLLAALNVNAAAPQVEMKTSMGTMIIELYPDRAPETVKNFLQYVKDGFYNGTVFHRVIPDFMIQGGGFTADLAAKTARGPIKNEADNGLTNVVGTVAMARTREPHSATSQFYINVVDNPALNFSAPADGSYGYCVFGKVVKGMEVAEKISKVATGPRPPHQNAPLQPVIIERVRLMNAPTKPAK